MDLVMDTAEVQLYRGDCREVMASLPDNSVDSIVTDPPYELGFMGIGWDSSGIAFDPEVWAQALRVLKPGGHLLAFGGTRTWHRVAVAIEDAGFEIRDSIAWLYGSGFPKSMDVSKAIDKARDEDAEPRRGVCRLLRAALVNSGRTRREIDEHFGTANVSQYWFSPDRNPQVPPVEKWPWVRDFLGIGPELDAEVWRLNGRKGKPGENWDKREVIGTRMVNGAEGSAGGYADGIASQRGLGGVVREIDITAPATPDAARWQGWGTALKPAHEPVVVARKPFQGTVAANVLAHGTGALNIDATRISTTDSLGGGANKGMTAETRHEGFARPWMRDDEAREAAAARSRENTAPAESMGRWPANVILDESQAAALDEQSGVLTSGLMKARTAREPRKGGTIYGADQRNITAGDTYADSGGASRFFYVAKAPAHERPEVDGTQHATVKPLTLMRYLVKLVTPPGGTVLEPFAGSGTTLEAAILEGFSCIGIELDEDGTHIPLIMQRLRKPLTPAMF